MIHEQRNSDLILAVLKPPPTTNMQPYRGGSNAHSRCLIMKILVSTVSTPSIVCVLEKLLIKKASNSPGQRQFRALNKIHMTTYEARTN